MQLRLEVGGAEECIMSRKVLTKIEMHVCVCSKKRVRSVGVGGESENQF